MFEYGVTKQRSVERVFHFVTVQDLEKEWNIILSEKCLWRVWMYIFLW